MRSRNWRKYGARWLLCSLLLCKRVYSMLARRLKSAAKPAILSGSAASVSLLPSSLCRQQKRWDFILGCKMQHLRPLQSIIHSRTAYCTSLAMYRCCYADWMLCISSAWWGTGWTQLLSALWHLAKKCSIWHADLIPGVAHVDCIHFQLGRTWTKPHNLWHRLKMPSSICDIAFMSRKDWVTTASIKLSCARSASLKSCALAMHWDRTELCASITSTWSKSVHCLHQCIIDFARRAAKNHMCKKKNCLQSNECWHAGR